MTDRARLATRASTADEGGWERFVLAHGWRAPLYQLAAVVGRPAEDVERVRRTGACARLAHPKGFVELFTLWHGRPPAEADWPAPCKRGGQGYEWLAPEVGLLASLVGTLGVVEIAQVLTARLRQLTGDASAERSPTAVQVRINAIGLQTKDVLGGITATEAGHEIGSLAIVQQAIAKGHLTANRVGRLLVIPYDAWAAWKATRVPPPDGYVQLSTLREQLAIRSDKLSEFARLGYIPTAIRCNPDGAKAGSTQFGTWYVDPRVAETLIADRQAGRPMPWHGKPIAENLRAAFGLWMQRRHPACCKTCTEIWGAHGPPQTFEDYSRRYPPLAHGAKRHLTRMWDPGLTVQELAAQSGRPEALVRRAIENGALMATRQGRHQYVSRTDASRWMARRCPTGDGEASWISLETASKLYQFTMPELEGFIDRGEMLSKTGSHGAARGVVYVPRQQCATLRETIGYTEAQAAQRIGVSVRELRKLLKGVDWRKAERIPLVTVQAVIKRLQSRAGYSLEEAAAILGVTEEWVRDRIRDGTIKVLRAKWNDQRTYISEPMLRRLEEARGQPVTECEPLDDDWLSAGAAALDAGVSVSTVYNWTAAGDLERRQSGNHWVYQRETVRARARRYWETVRLHRAALPTWLQAERRRGAGETSPPQTLVVSPVQASAEADAPPPVCGGNGVADVDAAIAALTHKEGLVIVRLKGNRYLVDGIRSWSEQQLLDHARQVRVF
ncbi:helix-turn-helix domain-containing protein [Azospirillum sp. sgz302134]